MFLLPTPPKESMGKKPKKLQSLMHEFSILQYEFFEKVNAEIEAEEYTALTEQEKPIFERVFQKQLEAYEEMNAVIENC